MSFNLSVHTHPESALTGSTLVNMVKRAKALGRTHFVQSDLGHLSSVLKSYGLAKKEGLKFIPGIQVYFKDSACDIVANSKANRCQYFTVSIYCQDQEAYQALSRIVSRTDFAQITVREEVQQLWNWSHLEEISKNNVQIVLGSPHCIVGKVMLAGQPDLAGKVLAKLVRIFPDKVSLGLVCEPWAKKYSQVIEVETNDGKISMLATDTVATNRARKMPAIDLIDKPGHVELISKISNSNYTLINKSIVNVTLHKGFLPYPGGDVTYKMNRYFVILAEKHGLKLVTSDYAYYANPEDKTTQTLVLEGKDRLHSNLHMKSSDEISGYLSNTLKLTPEQLERVSQNNDTWAESFGDFKFKYDWRLADAGEDTLKRCMQIIREKGRMRWDDPIYVERLKEEIKVIAKNPKKDLSGYFLPIVDVINHYIENDQLVGVARGSAGGSLFCYLLGVTNLDPIKYNLSFPRFLSLDRLLNGDVPDVDSDFGDRKLLVGEDGKSGYLYGRWGNKAAQISTRHTVRLKSAIKDTNRFFNGSVEPEIEKFTSALPDPPQGVEDFKFIFGYENDGAHEPGLIEIYEPLQDYIAARPKEWEIVQKAIGITRAFSQHASAFVIADIPLPEIMPLKDGHITQYEAKAVETAGAIKYDFLVVTHIKDIETCLKLINKKNNEKQTIGYFTHNDKVEYIWDLPNDINAFKSVWAGNTESIFQIDTKTMAPAVRDIRPESVEDISTILALRRPGPMDYVDPDIGRTMDEEYIWRRQGRSQPNLKELYDLIPETYGIIVFQEQSLKISKELGGMSASDAEKLRRIFSKKLKAEALAMKPVFMSTAVPKIGEDKANKIWDMMETASRYSFNASHSTAYAIITYACIFLRYHYPLEWWAAILTNAKEKEISGELWKYVKDMVYPPDINLSSDEMTVDYDRKKIRAKLGVIRGMGDATIEPIVAGRPYKDIADFVDKKVAGQSLSHKLIHVGVLDSLFPVNFTAQEKFLAYEQAVENKAFSDKLIEATKERRKIRATQPKLAAMPEKYLNLHPIQEAVMKKSVLPSMRLDLHALGKAHSKILVQYTNPPMVKSPTGHRTLLVDGEKVQRLDSIEPGKLKEDIYIAATGYVVEAKEFAYPKKNPTKKALKMVVDFDGFISERVLWPNYNSGQLERPEGLEKGCIATFFLRKKIDRKDLNIQGVVVES